MIPLAKAYFRVCRFEYLPAELAALVIPIFITARSPGIFLELKVLESMVLSFFLYLSGFLINAWTDREIDAKYSTFKTSIAGSVSVLGERRLKALIGVHLAISLVLGIHISILMGSLIPILLVVLGIFFGFGYSMKPFSFKTRGVLFHFVSLSLCAFFIPLVFLLFVVNGSLTFGMLLFSVGFTLVHYGLAIGNQILDYEEDLAWNMRTPPVRIGLKNALGLSILCLLLGIPMMIAILFLWFQESSVLRGIPSAARSIVCVIAISSFLLAGYFITFRGFYLMHKDLRNNHGLKAIMKSIRSRIDYARWQIFGVSGIFILSIALFLTKLI